MKINDENYKKLINQDEDDLHTGTETGSETGGETGGEGKGGQAGEIRFRFRDAAQLPPRDDALPPSEIKRLLIVHKELHKSRVDNQKTTRKERQALKEGRLNQVASYQQRMAGFEGIQGSSKYKQHPISNRAQFAGIDKQLIGIPTEFNAETNLEMRDKLENKNRLTHRNELRNELRNENRYTPKFRPPGM
jgi:hypothetical protein